MKLMKPLLGLAVLACSSMAAAEELKSIDSKKEVAYRCLVENHPVQMTAMYGIKNNEVVVAQVKVNDDISPALFRVPDILVNRFVSDNNYTHMWTTLPANGNNVDKVDGGILSFKAPDGTQTIVMEKCTLDKAATAKLNKP